MKNPYAANSLALCLGSRLFSGIIKVRKSTNSFVRNIKIRKRIKLNVQKSARPKDTTKDPT